jgi:hypothetical protein
LARRLPACRTDGKSTSISVNLSSGGFTHETRSYNQHPTRTGPFDDGRSGWRYNRRGLGQYAEEGGPAATGGSPAATDGGQLAAQQEALAQQQAAAQQTAAAGPAPGSLDYQAAEIQKLNVMKEQGLITDEEFAAKKRQILGI